MNYNYSWWNKNKNNNNNNYWNKTNYSNYNTTTAKPVVETKEVEQEVVIQDNYTYLKNLLCKPKIETLEFTPYAWAKINCDISIFLVAQDILTPDITPFVYNHCRVSLTITEF